MGVQVADTLAWLSDELRSECSQPVLQRARGIANQWRSKMEDLHCLNDAASNRITLYATIRGTTSPSSRYEVQATLDFADELFLARYCSCPAFSGSQRGYGSYRTFDYHNSPKYRSFDDDDDYDYVDDYDDFGSGSTYGHVNDDDDSASSTSRRYTGMCKHVAAMLLLFLQQPERFRGFHAAAATPRALADYMRSLDAKSNNAGENAQLDVLKRIINAKSRLIEEQRGASGQGAAKPKRKSSAPVDVKPGSVYLEPTLINGHDALRLSLRIGCGDADYALKNISRFVADMRTGTYESYGKKLAFTHTPDMLDPFSLKLYRFLQQVIASRTAAQLQNGYYYGEAVRIDRELVLTDWEACDLLDLFHVVTQDEYKEHESKARGFLRTSDGDGLRRLLIEDFQRTKKSGPSRIHMANEGGEPFGLDIVEGDPTFTFKASYVHEGTASGVRITSNQSISDVINGRNGFYIFSRERPDDSTETDRIGIDGLFRCTDKLRPALQVLPDLCSDDPDGVFIAENDWPMFARTIVPKLTEAGIGFDIPQEVTEAVGTECRIEFYLDRDLYGITCEAVAKYGDFTFQLVPTAKELRGVINPDSRSRASQVKRDLSRESFAVQVVRQLCPTWSSIDVARVKEEDEQAILLMLTDGVQILKSVGQVFSTAAFDGMMQPNPPSVKVGLSIDSNLVEISPIADEVPMNEVGALLDSYRRKRRYHRLKNGTFVDLKEADLHELDQVSTDLDLSEKQLDSGIIKIPGYQAFLLDSQVDDEGKSASFVDYVNDVKIVDPKRYEVPERLKTVLRPYQVEGFQWLSTLWDKGFGGILADEMGLGKSVQLLSLIEARKGNGPSLIVCPASLVYNWAAECEKFAGDLTVEVVAGTKAQRRKAIATVAAQSQENDGATTNGTTTYDGTDVVIDLLRSAASRRGRLRSLPFRADGARRGAIHQKPCHKGGQIGQTGHGRPSLRSDRHANRKPVERTVEHFRLPHARTARHLYEIPRKIRAADHGSRSGTFRHGRQTADIGGTVHQTPSEKRRAHRPARQIRERAHRQTGRRAAQTVRRTRTAATRHAHQGVGRRLQHQEDPHPRRIHLAARNLLRSKTRIRRREERLRQTRRHRRTRGHMHGRRQKGPRVLAIHLVPRTHRRQTRRTRRGILHHRRRDAEETPCGTGRRIQWQ